MNGYEKQWGNEMPIDLENDDEFEGKGRYEQIEEIERLREIAEIKALRAKNEESARKSLFGPPLSEQFKLNAVPSVSAEVARNVPIAGPLAEKFADLVTTPEQQEETRNRRSEAFRKYPDLMKGAALAGSIGGAFALPSPASGVGGVTGSLGRIAETGAIAGTDAALRGEDALGSGIEAAQYAFLAEAARPKFYNRVFGGIPDEMQDFYTKNRKAVNAARPTDELAQSLGLDAKRVQREISQGSGDSYRILRESRQAYPLDSILGALDTARTRISEMGAFGKGEQALLKEIDRLGYRIMQESKDMQSVDPDKVKSFITAYRNATDAYRKGQLGLGHPAGQGYTKSVLREADSAMDSALKELVPEYGEQMRKVSRATQAIKPLEKTLSNETKATHYVKRLMRGSDPAGMKALKDFDAVAGTNYASELPASYTREYLERPNIHGSRQVNMGRSVGKAVAGDFGEMVGGIAGGAQDIYARKIGKVLLDISALPGLGYAGQMLQKAALKSPYAAMGMYRFLKNRDQAFREKMDDLLNEEEGGQ